MTIIKVMPKKQPFALVYADEAKDQLRTIEAKYYSLIQAAIESQLLHEPDVETRNRKPLKRPIAFGADWELRFGPDNRFRVFYQVKAESREVRVLAIGVKDRSRLYFGGKELDE
jgi:mRNA-degrading endonuclease RelE of RelBE toxin-antitoxin system